MFSKKDPNYRRLSLVDVFLVFALFYVVFCVVGCANLLPASQPAPAPTPKYQLTLLGQVDGVSFQGTAIGSNAESHQMTIQSAIDVDYFTVQSCHRSLQFSNVITYPWLRFTDNRTFTWTYNMAPTIEDDGDCILRFCAFSKVVGSPPVSCGIVDFHNDRYQLPFQDICNGANGAAAGTGFCHTQVGLIERVQFQSPVVAARQVIDPTGKQSPYWITNQCVGKFLDVAQTLFQYQVPDNECSIIFMEQAKPHRRAKLTVIPYDTPNAPVAAATGS